MAVVGSLLAALHSKVYERRVAVLVESIVPHLVEGDKVLDVGCGSGLLGRALLDYPLCPEGVELKGLERLKRAGTAIDVIEYDGDTIPFADKTFDAVILADVLHHEIDPEKLLGECVRVSRRLLIIKDHQINGLLAQWRVSFLDWAANSPYGVPCLYHYYSPEEWRRLPARYNLKLIEEQPSMQLYPRGLNLFFAGSLQYFAVLAVKNS
jgi:SAM-dependent methyltransferase